MKNFPTTILQRMRFSTAKTWCLDFGSGRYIDVLLFFNVNKLVLLLEHADVNTRNALVAPRGPLPQCCQRLSFNIKIINTTIIIIFITILF